MSIETPVLLTIPLSHYCERARWALDHAGVEYREERHLQRFHLRPVRKVTRGHTVPVLIADGAVMDDSHDILAWADARTDVRRSLYPEAVRAEIAALEPRFEGELGVEARRIAYHWFLDVPKLLIPANEVGAPWHERVVVRAAFPFLARGLRKYFRITDETVARGEARIHAIFDDVAAKLADGRAFLAGDAFTALDLTFASLAAPVLLPAAYGVPFPPAEALPPRLRGHVERMRDHRAARFALELYENERRRFTPTV